MRKFFYTLWRVLSAPFRFLLWLLRGIYGWLLNLSQVINKFFTEEVEDAPLPDTLTKTLENPQELLVHIDALRKHLVRIVIVLGLATVISFIFSSQILQILAAPLENGFDSLIAIDVTEPIGTVMRVSLLSGVAIAFPYIALEVWLFIAPGLKRNSRYYGLIAIPVTTIFFLGGMAFAYFVMLPTALPFLLTFGGINTIPRVSSYIKFVTNIMFWLGVAFEFPIVIFILASLGLVSAKTLAQHWRLAVVIIAVIAALITPTVDPVNMALVMGPLILLYMLSIGLAKIAQRGRGGQTQEELLNTQSKEEKT
ncbi:twin-arginine translocase subunit TatC [Chloroflexota bacterium]